MAIKIHVQIYLEIHREVFGYIWMTAQKEVIKKKGNFHCRNITSLWNTLWLTLLLCAGDLKNTVEDKDWLWILCWWRLKIPLNSCWIILKGKSHVSAVDSGYLLALWQGKTGRQGPFHLRLCSEESALPVHQTGSPLWLAGQRREIFSYTKCSLALSLSWSV